MHRSVIFFFMEIMIFELFSRPTTITGQSTTAVPVDCSVTSIKVPNSNVLGGILSESASDLTECQSGCVTRASCYGFDWDRLQSRCFHILDRDFFINYNSTSGVDHYNIMKNTSNCIDDCSYAQWVPQVDIHSFGGNSRRTTSLNDCISLCILDPSCTSVDWDPSNSDGNRCWLLTASSPTAFSRGVYHYTKDCIRTRVPSTLVPKNSTSIPAGTTIPSISTTTLPPSFTIPTTTLISITPSSLITITSTSTTTTASSIVLTNVSNSVTAKSSTTLVTGVGNNSMSIPSLSMKTMKTTMTTGNTPSNDTSSYSNVTQSRSNSMPTWYSNTTEYDVSLSYLDVTTLGSSPDAINASDDKAVVSEMVIEPAYVVLAGLGGSCVLLVIVAVVILCQYPLNVTNFSDDKSLNVYGTTDSSENNIVDMSIFEQQEFHNSGVRAPEFEATTLQ